MAENFGSKMGVRVEQAKLHAVKKFKKYRIIQDRLFMSDFDIYMSELEKRAKSISDNHKYDETAE